MVSLYGFLDVLHAADQKSLALCALKNASSDWLTSQRKDMEKEVLQATSRDIQHQQAFPLAP